ncbi:hypothetical protein RB595_007079 [Gaeumannomyces hyphopodioides]
MSAIYAPLVVGPVSYNGAPIHKTQSSTNEVNRIMNWNYGVATSAQTPEPHPARSAAPRSHYASPHSHFAGSTVPVPDQGPYILRRSVTTSTVIDPPYPPGSPREGSNGGMTTGMAGLLGAAVGAVGAAAVTYSMLTRERPPPPSQEMDVPAFQRRSTYPEPFPDHRRGRFVELERTVEKLEYPQQYPQLESGPGAAPAYMARYSQVPGHDDARSRASTRYQLVAPPPSLRTPTEVSAARGPQLLLTETEHRSHVGSRYGGEADARSYAPSRHPMEADARSYAQSRRHVEADARSYAPSRYAAEADTRSRAPSRYAAEAEPRNYAPLRPLHEIDARARFPASIPIPASVIGGSTYDAPNDAATYVSTRSHRTAKPMPEAASYQVAGGARPPRASSRVAAGTMRDPAEPRTFSRSQMPPRGHAPSNAGTRVSARQVELPKSRSGWDVDDDADSIGPDDSISCVGSKPRSRSRGYH